MSRDIRSYFSTGSKKPSTSSSPAAASSPAPKTKSKNNSFKDDDEEIPVTPNDKKQINKTGQKRRRIIDSDEEHEWNEKKSSNTSKKPNLKKLKEHGKQEKPKEKKLVDVSKVFASEPVRFENKKTVSSEKKVKDDTVTLDDDFDESMVNLDETILIEEKVNNEKKKKQQESTKNESPSKVSPQKKTSEKLNVEVTPKNTPEESAKKLSNKDKSLVKEEKPALSKLGANKTLEEKVGKTPEPGRSDLETSVRSDEDRFEKKRVAAVLYQKFKNRSSVINHGCKEIPKGKPDCFKGLSFLVTGILESLERDEANDLIKSFGGKISSTVGKRLNYMVAGEEAGPKKLATAEDLGIKIISEDQLFDLIREKSGDKNSNNIKTESSSGENKVESENLKKKRKTKSDNDEIPIKKEKLNESPKIKDEKNEKIEDIEIIVIPDTEIKEVKFTGSLETQAWVDKYKPKSIKEIIGQQGAASNCVKLKNWLSKWYSNHDGKKKLQKPSPWAKNDDGSYYKAALLSGPPGVGKTTTATLVCQELGFDTVEFNASDTRSKKLLKAEVSELLSNQSLYGYFNGDLKTVSSKHVLLMDEVDGMAGNEDRGGIQELISLIKDTSVPIICMCNDRNHQKMRSLVNYCYDLRFNKPRLEQIKGPIMSICFREKIKIPPAKIEEIITATNNDIRQTLNHLSLLSADKDLQLKGNVSNTAKKDLKLGPWEVVRKVFSEEEHKKMTLNDRSDLFFHDYSLGPLFVQQNYLMVSPHVPKPQVPQQVALAADALSLGDLVDKRIRSNSAWSLLPTQAMFSSVLPGTYMAGHFVGQINFPAWLGKNSRSTKRSRLAQEIHDHTRIRTSGSRLSIRLDYAPFLLSAILLPLKNKGSQGVEESLKVMKEYRLLREDVESLVELTSWPGKKNPMDAVDSKVKAAFTRSYNKEVLAYSYSAGAGVKKKRSEAHDDELDLMEAEQEGGTVQISEDEDDDNLENDGLIKTRRAAAKAALKSITGTNKEKASTSAKAARGGKAKK